MMKENSEVKVKYLIFVSVMIMASGALTAAPGFAAINVRIVHAEGGASHYHDDGTPCGENEPQVDDEAANNAKKAAQTQCGSAVEQATAFEYTRRCVVRMSIYRSAAKADFKCL